jgi:rod shape-determining protein MreC
MIRWEKYIFAFRDYIILFFLLTISVILIVNNDKPQIHWIRSKVLNVIGIWQNTLGTIQQYRTLKTENEILRERLALLSYDNSLYKEAFLENDRLRNLLEFKRKSKFDLISVNLIRKNYLGLSHSFNLNVGSDDGIKVNMPVVSSEGLIGNIVFLSSNNSVVQVMDDINFRVSGMIQRSRVTGIVQPDQNSYLRFEYVPLIEDVIEGDVIVTSGYSDIFPEGVEIGIVRNISDSANGLFKLIYITPSVDLANVEDAFIIKNSQIENK